MKRVAIYARYSTDLQSPASIDDQIQLCRAYADRHGWVVVATYQDAALSGFGVEQR
jgi:DNA invertase Pin-like site-specific DNA recombinase